MQTRLPWAAEPSPCEQAEVVQWPDSLRKETDGSLETEEMTGQEGRKKRALISPGTWPGALRSQNGFGGWRKGVEKGQSQKFRHWE